MPTRRFFYALLLLLILTLNLTLPAAAQTSCPDLPDSRLVIGEAGQVLAGSPNNLRLEPSKDAEILTEIPADARFLVIDGPTCADEFAWWQVAYGEFAGWTVENVGDDYAVEPVEATQNEVIFGGVTFNLDSRISPKVTGQVFPSSSQDNTSQPFWLQTPGFINFALSDNFENPGTRAAFAIYPATALGEVQQTTALLDLQTMLAERPIDVEPPMLPIVGAERVLVSQVEYLDFDGGSGVRFVAYFSQSVDPLTSGSIDYIFLGLTDQGEHYIQVYLPLVTTLFPPLLPPDFDYDAFITTYPQYLDATQQTLDAATSADFAPSLEVLDSVVASLVINAEGVGGTLNGDNSLTARCELAAIADTRLRMLPDVSSDISDYLPAGVPVLADAQFQRRGEQFPWWRLSNNREIRALPNIPSFPGSRWIRADFTTENGNCSDLPVIINP